VSKSRAPFTLIWLSTPGAKARQIDVPRGLTAVVGVVAALSLCLSLGLGRKARAWANAEELRRESACKLAAKDLEQSPAEVRGRSPFFQAAQPGATYTELAHQVLKLYDVNGRRSIAVSPFRTDGRGDPEAFTQLSEFMRCRRTGHTMDMSPVLIQLLMRISAHFEGAELQVISAHRAVDGVVTSEGSQHGKGTASDIRIAGIAVEELAEAAHEEGARGVGIYTRSGFVHVDVREKPYAWRGLDESDDDSVQLEGDSPSDALESESSGSVAADSIDEPPQDEGSFGADTLEGTTLSGL
jgi:uncharacterized protein YcbK (DUF882 family)